MANKLSARIGNDKFRCTKFEVFGKSIDGGFGGVIWNEIATLLLKFQKIVSIPTASKGYLVSTLWADFLFLGLDENLIHVEQLCLKLAMSELMPLQLYLCRMADRRLALFG